jgi:hypothetical protein
MLLIDLPQPPHATAPELGVIREARRRRRRRLAAAGATLAALLAGALVLAGRGGTASPHPPALRPSSSPTRLTGPPLLGATHLRLFADTNGGVPYILDVDRGALRRVLGLGIPAHYSEWGASASISPAPGGALAVVDHQACQHCARSQVLFTVRADGSVRRIAALSLASSDTTTPDPGVAAEWVAAATPGGGCTLRLVPGAGPAVPAPCGFLDLDASGALAISTSHGLVFVDPRSGSVLEPMSRRAASVGQLDPLAGNLALEGSGIEGDTELALVDLATGARTKLRWPSVVRDGYVARPEPGGPLVALTFIDPYYGPSHAPLVDVWVLDTRTATFTHVPGFPAAEDFKQSNVAWASDGRLVIAAQINPPDGSAVVGIWRPGQATLPLRAVPVSAGGAYNRFIPVFG